MLDARSGTLAWWRRLYIARFEAPTAASAVRKELVALRSDNRQARRMSASRLETRHKKMGGPEADATVSSSPRPVLTGPRRAKLALRGSG